MAFAPDKTDIREIEKEGFDFLGWNFGLFQTFKKEKAWKRAKGKLVTLVHPSAKSLKSIKD
jgi:hypothetical protein